MKVFYIKISAYFISGFALLLILGSMVKAHELHQLEKTPEGRARIIELRSLAEEKRLLDIQKDLAYRKQQIQEEADYMKLRSIKNEILNSAKNPDSINFRTESINGNVVCLTYTGTNSFGGVVMGYATYYSGGIHYSIQEFKNKC